MATTGQTAESTAREIASWLDSGAWEAARLLLDSAEDREAALAELDRLGYRGLAR